MGNTQSEPKSKYNAPISKATNSCDTDDTNGSSFNEVSKPVFNEQKSVSESMENAVLSFFENIVLARELVSAMALIDAYCIEIDFSKHYFKNGDTPIHYAVRLHNVHFLMYLLHKGYDVNRENDLTGDTALHVAVKHGDMIMVGILLKFDADINCRNMLNKTPKDIAKKNNDFELIYMFNNFQTILDKAPKMCDSSKLLAPRYALSFSEDEEEVIDDGTILLSPYKRYDASEIGMSPMSKDKRNIYNNNYMILPVPTTPTNSSFKVTIPTPGVSPSKSKAKNIVNINTPITQVPPIGQIAPMDIMANCLKNINDNTFDICDIVSLYNVDEKKFQVKYLFVKDFHLIWNHKNKRYNTNHCVNTAELSKYCGYIHVFLIKYIETVKIKNAKGYAFVIYTYGYGSSKNTMKNGGQYLFKCDTKKKKRYVG